MCVELQVESESGPSFLVQAQESSPGWALLWDTQTCSTVLLIYHTCVVTAVQCSAVQCSVVQCSKVLYSAGQVIYCTVPLGTLQFS